MSTAGAETPTERPDALVGTLLADRYHILRRLGKGGMAIVYLAKDRKFGREVAVKVLRTDVASDPIAAKRLVREGRAAGQLQHPHIITIYDIDESEGLVYVVMEVLVGCEMSDLMEQVGAIAVDRAVNIGRQVAAALAAAHASHIIHRDIKPENLFLIDHPEGGDYVKMLDFSIAKLPTNMITAALTRAGSVFGTPHYMAPEQVEGRPVCPQTDIYALGAVMYELIAGEPPFDGDSVIDILLQHVKTEPRRLSSFGARLPPGLDDLVASMLAKKESDRPKSAGDVDRQLSRMMTEMRAEDDAPASTRGMSALSVAEVERAKSAADAKPEAARAGEQGADRLASGIPNAPEKPATLPSSGGSTLPSVDLPRRGPGAPRPPTPGSGASAAGMDFGDDDDAPTMIGAGLAALVDQAARAADEAQGRPSFSPAVPLAKARPDSGVMAPGAVHREVSGAHESGKSAKSATSARSGKSAKSAAPAHSAKPDQLDKRRDRGDAGAPGVRPAKEARRPSSGHQPPRHADSRSERPPRPPTRSPSGALPQQPGVVERRGPSGVHPKAPREARTTERQSSGSDSVPTRPEMKADPALLHAMGRSERQTVNPGETATRETPSPPLQATMAPSEERHSVWDDSGSKLLWVAVPIGAIGLVGLLAAAWIIFSKG